MSLIVGPHHPFASTDEAINPVVPEEEILIVREPRSGSREVISQALSANGKEPCGACVRTDHRTDDLVFRKEAIPSLHRLQDAREISDKRGGPNELVEYSGFKIDRSHHHDADGGRPKQAGADPQQPSRRSCLLAPPFLQFDVLAEGFEIRAFHWEKSTNQTSLRS
jgi:hypothetical protein